MTTETDKPIMPGVVKWLKDNSPFMTAISERDFSTQVEDLLKLYGWRYTHFRPARTKHGWVTAITGDPGFPDYLALKDKIMLVFELKSEKGKVSEDQQAWHDDFKKAGITVLVFRPSDFDSIARLLGI